MPAKKERSKRQVAGAAPAAATVNAAGGEFEIDIRQGQDDAASRIACGVVARFRDASAACTAFKAVTIASIAAGAVSTLVFRATVN